MAMQVTCHANVSKQMTLLGAVDLTEWRVCGGGLNRSIHGGMNDISNVKLFWAYKLLHATGSR